MNDRRKPPEIRPASEKDTTALAHLTQRACKNVALRFGRTPGNCPKHPSNCTEAWICSDLDRNVAYCLLSNDDTRIGCASLEPLRGVPHAAGRPARDSAAVGSVKCSPGI